MSETAYWVWLQCALGEGAAVQPLLEEFGSAKAVYDANIMEWRMTPALTKYQVQHLESTPLSAADKVLSTCKQQGWQLLAALTKLELLDLAESAPGSRFRKK